MMGLRQAEIPREGIRESDRAARENLTEARSQLVERLLKEADVDQWVLVSDLFQMLGSGCQLILKRPR